MGALRMGVLHGVWCLGCCWLLFAILFPLGIMNMATMAAVTVLVFAEKTLPHGRWTARATAAVLVTYGALVITLPRTLPTYPVGGGRAAPVHAGMPMRMDMSGHGDGAPRPP